MCQEALRLGSFAHCHTVRQPHIKVSSHTLAQTHKATTWTAQPDPENPKVEAQTNAFTHFHTLILLLFFTDKRSTATRAFTVCIFLSLEIFIWLYHSVHNNRHRFIVIRCISTTFRGIDTLASILIYYIYASKYTSEHVKTVVKLQWISGFAMRYMHVGAMLNKIKPNNTLLDQCNFLYF